MGQLTINEEIIPLEPDTVIAITLQVNNVAAVDDRQSTFTNSFRVPKTQATIKALEYLDKLSSQTRLPYQKLPARYVQSGIQVVKNGYATISEVGEDFEITLYDGNISFFSLIADKSLRDITSFENPYWSIATALASRTATNGYIWAIIDWFVSQSVLERKFNVSKAHPSYFIKDLIEAIVATTEYTITGDFLASDLYQNLILPLTTKKQEEKYFLTEATTTGDVSGLQVFADFDNEISDPLGTIISGGCMLSEVSTVNVPFGNGTATYWRYRAYCEGSYSFYIKVNYQTVDDGGIIRILRKPLLSNDASIVTASEPLLADTTGFKEFFIYDLQLEKAEEIYVCALKFDTVPFGSVAIKEDSIFKCTAAKDLTTYYGMPFPIAINLPDISQKDFIKAIMQMFCIIPITNNLRKEVVLVQFKEIVKNKSAALDWSENVDTRIRAKIIFRVDSYARKNYLRYKEDDTVTKDYGDGSFEIDDENLDNEKTLLTLPFAASDMIARLGGLLIPEIGDSTSDDVQPRVLILDRRTFEPEIEWTDGVTDSTPGGDEPMCYFELQDKTENLNFNNNIIDNHYSDFVEMLNDFKKVIVGMRLTAVDIEQLDFSIPIYLKQFGHYFYINKISQWRDRSTTCIVELIKI